MVWRWGAAAAVIALTAACSSATRTAEATTTVAAPFGSTTTAIPAPTTSAPPVYTAFADRADRFKISVPTTWTQIDPSSATAAARLQALIKANPDLQSVFGSGLATFASAGIKFYAYDPLQPGRAPSVNVSVNAEPAGASESDLPEVATETIAQYHQVGGTVTGPFSVSIGGYRADQLNLLIPFASSTGNFTRSETQYFLIANDKLYSIVFAGDSPQFSHIQSTFSVQ